MICTATHDGAQPKDAESTQTKTMSIEGTVPVEMKGISTSASTETAEHQNSGSQPTESGGQVTPDTAFDTSRRWTPWRPIETAPKDGTRIWAKSNGCEPHVYYWRSGDYANWCVDYANGAAWQPTEWRPIDDEILVCLYEALDGLVNYVNRPEGPFAWELMDQAKAALAKARGEN